MRMLLLELLILASRSGDAQPIDGCPMWGCRPSGSFSFTLDVPKVNVTVDWVSDFFIGPVPNGGGCVGNSKSLVCQSNGPGPADVGYMGIDAPSGGVQWRDPILKFPTLPVMDTYGDVWGSDGGQLMSYDTNGKPMGPQIPVEPNMRPMFDMQIVDGNILLMVSENGAISSLLTDGTPFASITLRGTVGRDNGTFLPTASPVVNGNRFYVITEFSPDNGTSANLGLQRLYAIDTHHSMGNMITVAWYANIEKEALSKQSRYSFYKPQRRTMAESLRETKLKPSILWDTEGQMVFLSLPSHMLGARQSPNAPARLFGIKDSGNSSAMVFKSDIGVVDMVMYEFSMHDNARDIPTAGSQLWVSLPDGKLVAITRTGAVEKIIDLPKLSNVTFTITSKIMSARAKDPGEDFLIFGIHVISKSQRFMEVARQLSGKADVNADYYVIGYDTEENAVFPLAWMIPTPENMPVTGQIVGVSGDRSGSKSRIVAFAQNEHAGKLFSIASKT